MVDLRTVMFIDGQNFRNNLRNFRFRSTPPSPDATDYRLEEKHFLWREYFRGVLDKFNQTTGWNHQLVRVYWYYAESISPWQERPDLAQRVIDRSIVSGLTVGQVTALAKEWYDQERYYFERLREQVFENIQRSVDFLEFKYVGQYVVRPYTPYRLLRNADGTITYLGTQQGEKGVDVGITVDMIAKMENYDVGILISGDADFLPVVGYLKDNLKYIYQFSLAKGVPPYINYLSAWLKGRVDCFAWFDEAELLTNYLDRTSGIPAAVMTAIDSRINDLSGS